MYGLLPILQRYLPKLFPTASDKGRPGLTVAAIASIFLNLRSADLNASSQTVVICCLCISLAIVGIMPPCLKVRIRLQLAGRISLMLYTINLIISLSNPSSGRELRVYRFATALTNNLPSNYFK